jgi:hypothetical protein
MKIKRSSLDTLLVNNIHIVDMRPTERFFFDVTIALSRNMLSRGVLRMGSFVRNLLTSVLSPEVTTYNNLVRQLINSSIRENCMVHKISLNEHLSLLGDTLTNPASSSEEIIVRGLWSASNIVRYDERNKELEDKISSEVDLNNMVHTLAIAIPDLFDIGRSNLEHEGCIPDDISLYTARLASLDIAQRIVGYALSDRLESIIRGFWADAKKNPDNRAIRPSFNPSNVIAKFILDVYRAFYADIITEIIIPVSLQYLDDMRSYIDRRIRTFNDLITEVGFELSSELLDDSGIPLIPSAIKNEIKVMETIPFERSGKKLSNGCLFTKYLQDVEDGLVLNTAPVEIRNILQALVTALTTNDTSAVGIDIFAVRRLMYLMDAYMNYHKLKMYQVFSMCNNDITAWSDVKPVHKSSFTRYQPDYKPIDVVNVLTYKEYARAISPRYKARSYSYNGTEYVDLIEFGSMDKVIVGFKGLDSHTAVLQSIIRNPVTSAITYEVYQDTALINSQLKMSINDLYSDEMLKNDLDWLTRARDYARVELDDLYINIPLTHDRTIFRDGRVSDSQRAELDDILSYQVYVTNLLSYSAQLKSASTNVSIGSVIRGIVEQDTTLFFLEKGCIYVPVITTVDYKDEVALKLVNTVKVDDITKGSSDVYVYKVRLEYFINMFNVTDENRVQLIRQLTGEPDALQHFPIRMLDEGIESQGGSLTFKVTTPPHNGLRRLNPTNYYLNGLLSNHLCESALAVSRADGFVAPSRQLFFVHPSVGIRHNLTTANAMTVFYFLGLQDKIIQNHQFSLVLVMMIDRLMYLRRQNFINASLLLSWFNLLDITNLDALVTWKYANALYPILAFDTIAQDVLDVGRDSHPLDPTIITLLKIFYVIAPHEYLQCSLPNRLLGVELGDGTRLHTLLQQCKSSKNSKIQNMSQLASIPTKVQLFRSQLEINDLLLQMHRQLISVFVGMIQEKALFRVFTIPSLQPVFGEIRQRLVDGPIQDTQGENSVIIKTRPGVYTVIPAPNLETDFRRRLDSNARGQYFRLYDGMANTFISHPMEESLQNTASSTLSVLFNLFLDLLLNENY